MDPHIAVFAAAELMLGFLGHSPMTFRPEVATAATGAWQEGTARLQFTGFMLLFATSAVAILAKFLLDLRSHFPEDSRSEVKTIFLIAVGAGAVVVGAVFFVGPRATSFVGGPLYAMALDSTAVANDESIWGEGTFSALILLTNVLAILAISALVAGAFSCLARFRGLDSEANWILQFERLKLYIYMSTWLLVVGVIFLRSWISYPHFLLGAGTDEATAFTALVDGYVTYAGIEFSLLLAAYAIPVVWKLQQRAEEIAAEIVRENRQKRPPPYDKPFELEVREVQGQKGLMVTAVDTLKTVAALLAPLLTGAVSSLTSMLA